MADMQYRRLGESGLAVSVVGLGCNNFGSRLDENGTSLVVDAAIDHGITLFDTSDSYSTSEELLGKSLKGRRDDVIIATKFGSDLEGGLGNDFGARGSRRYINKAIERSLKRLQTDWVDLYQLHRPDPETPLEETLGALTDLVHEGKVRYIGCSNFSGWQIADADWIASTKGTERFISVQNRYNLISREAETEVIPACERFGLGMLPYSPLSNGLLTGKVRRDQPPPEGTRLAKRPGELTDQRFDALDELEGFAREHGVSILEVAIGGLAAQPTVASVIAGAMTPAQVAANVAAGAWEPTAEEMDALNARTPR